MKRFLLALVLSVASFIALAAPSPKQIEGALAAKDYASAKTMITQVLAERPDSARAHLMKAYVLAAADKNKEAAKSELAIAKTLDKNGDVVNSPLFGRTVGAIDAIAVAAVIPPPAPRAVAPPPAPYVPAPVVVAKKDEGHGAGFWIFITLLLAGGVGGAVYFISRRPKEVVPSYSSTSYAPLEPEPAAQRIRPRVDDYDRTPSPVHRPTYSGMNDSYGQSGMSTGAAVATGAVAGVAAAVVVDTMVENARLRERERYNSGSGMGGMNSGMGNTWGTPAPAPYAPPPPPVEELRVVDYVDEVQSFSSSNKQTDSWEAPPPAPPAPPPYVPPAPAPYVAPAAAPRDDWSSSRNNDDSWASAPPPPAAAPSDDSGW